MNDVDELGQLPNAGHRYWVEVTDFDNCDLIRKDCQGANSSSNKITFSS
jgi:hypothetical protein